MLLVIQPLTDYNLRTCLVLAVLSFLAWYQYTGRRHHGHLKLRSWFRGQERHCEKCDQHLTDQLIGSATASAAAAGAANLKPSVSWNVRSVRRLPLRLLSRHWGKLADARPPRWLAVVIVWTYAKVFGCKVEEAADEELSSYPSLGDFFCRRLKPGARPVCPGAAVVSPADGTVTHAGGFHGGFLQQVKGVHYSINYFLGLENAEGSHRGLHAALDVPAASSLLRHKDGSTSLFQWVVYLSPGDYHRFHSPAEWTVHKRRYLIKIHHPFGKTDI